MILHLLYILIALVAVFITILYRRSLDVKKKLWWVPAAPGLPLIGNANEFSDSTKSLNAMHSYVLKNDGLCYIELLFRPLILVTDYKFLEWLLSSNTLLTKGPEYQFLYNWLQGGLLISTGSEWKKSRKILTPSFHFAILEQLADGFEKSTSVLINILSKEVGKDSVNIYPFITRYTLDVICQTSMGVQLNVQEGGRTDYQDAVAGMCNIVAERAFNPLKMIDLFYYLSFDYLREKKYVKLLHKVSNDIIDKRRREIENEKEKVEDNEFGTKRKTAFLDLLLKYRDDNGQSLSQDFIRHEVDTFLFAGHDTTGTAISFALYCLANHHEVQTEALKEIKEVLGVKDKITYRDLQDMKYLELVIKESLRLFPPVPMYTRQTTEDVAYDDNKIIPKGVTLLVLSYSVNRNPKVYDQPDKFMPSRWLNMDIKPYSYVPFSVGPRNCIGQKFAILEMKNALAKILLNFELLPAVPEQNVILAAESVLKPRNGLHIKMEKRV